MKNAFKLMLVSCGFIMALAATTGSTTAQAADQLPVDSGAGCVGAGDCGTTVNGTKLNGSWREW